MFYRAHLEIEIVNSTEPIGYMVKYVSKNNESSDITLQEKKIF